MSPGPTRQNRLLPSSNCWWLSLLSRFWQPFYSPVFAQAREKARQASCLSNTKQLGLGIYQYIQDYDEALPMGGYNYAGTYGSRWYRDVYPYVKNLGVFICPSKNETGWVPSLNSNLPFTPLGPSGGRRIWYECKPGDIPLQHRSLGYLYSACRYWFWRIFPMHQERFCFQRVPTVLQVSSAITTPQRG